MNRILLIIIVLFVCSCSLFESVSKGEKVAQVEGAILYKSDLDKIVPKGLSSADSTAFVNQYINSWSIKQLMLKKAEENLPEEDKNVEQLLNDYKAQLLIFRYEKKFLEERLDTLVSSQEREEFYNLYPDRFIGKNGLMKGRVIRLHNSSPNLQVFGKLVESRDSEDLMNVEELAKNSALMYNNFNDEWVDMAIVAREAGIHNDELQKELKKGNLKSITIKDSLYTNFIQIVEYVKPGEITPFEYNSGKIKEIIISKRKQDMLNKLHNDILKDALNNKKFNILKNDKEAK